MKVDAFKLLQKERIAREEKEFSLLSLVNLMTSG